MLKKYQLNTYHYQSIKIISKTDWQASILRFTKFLLIYNYKATCMKIHFLTRIHSILGWRGTARHGVTRKRWKQRWKAYIKGDYEETKDNRFLLTLDLKPFELGLKKSILQTRNFTVYLCKERNCWHIHSYNIDKRNGDKKPYNSSE